VRKVSHYSYPLLLRVLQWVECILGTGSTSLIALAISGGELGYSSGFDRTLPDRLLGTDH
jgi:hypothetical protein